MIHIKRPFLVVVIGYIVGILWGLYLKNSIILFYIPIIAICLFYQVIRKKKSSFKLFSTRRYFRYFKLIFPIKIISIFMISSIISNLIVLVFNQKYENISQDGEKIQKVVVVVGRKEEKQYKVSYQVKWDGFYAYLYLDKKKDIELDIGDKVEVRGTFQKSEIARNEGGFDQTLFHRSKKICGILQGEEVHLLSHTKGISIEKLTQELLDKIEKKIELLLDKEKSALLKGLLLGDTSQIEEEQKEAFRISSLTHVLAVSGMHIVYIMVGINAVLLKLLGKNKTRLVLIVFLLVYAAITRFTPSVLRAVFMAILVSISKLLHRKNDTINTLAFSLWLILLDNPYAIMNIGLQLSYMGTIGILFFHSIFQSLLQKKETKNKQKERKIQENSMIKKLKEILIPILAAQIVILPISIFYFNSFGVYSILANILISIFVGPVIILGFMMVIASFLFFPVAKMLAIFLQLGLNIIIGISGISQLPFANMYFSTPSMGFIIVYYIVIFVIGELYLIYQNKFPNSTQIRIKNIIAMIKIHIRHHFKRYRNVSIVLVIFWVLFSNLPQKLEIHFVDVGQGDSTFIETPLHHTILIDGGGSEFSNFDVGKNTLLPYILDKGYTQIDYIFISHFDQDHVRSDC